MTFWAATWEDYERLRADREDRELVRFPGTRVVTLQDEYPKIDLHSPAPVQEERTVNPDE